MNKLFFWNWHLGADKVIARFDRGEMSNSEKFRYFLFVSLIVTVLYETTALIPYEHTTADVFYILISVVSLLLGSIYLYKKHKSGTSFVEKYFVVIIATIPVILICIMAPVYAIVIATYPIMYGPETIQDGSSWYEIASVAVISVATYLKLGTYFK